MSFTAKIIKSIPQRSTNLFKDLLLPVNQRSGFASGTSHVIPVYSYRYIGIKDNSKDYYDELGQLDQTLSQLGGLYLLITQSLPLSFREQLTKEIQDLWEKSSSQNKELIPPVAFFQQSSVFPFFHNDSLNAAVENKFITILNLYQQNSSCNNTTIIKNFSIKLLNWIYEFVPPLMNSFNIDSISQKAVHNPKVLFYGDIKEHEIYFLLFLSMIGADVLYIHTASEGKFQSIDRDSVYFFLMSLPKSEPLKEFPRCTPASTPMGVVTGAESRAAIPAAPLVPAPAVPLVPLAPVAPVTPAVPVVPANPVIPVTTPAQPLFTQPTVHTVRAEKSFEELATLSGSTVMIIVYDNEGVVLGGGSGVVIGHDGLIVTNYHVIERGCYYGVLFEGTQEHNKHEIYTVINENRQRDLALLKIHQPTVPIAIDMQDNVVRGQRVVAIGSPLGLMNTFSDGIISGFRKSENLDFIQTTTPISPGSSGGALLNMYGELIGVTAGLFINGQNLNLAIPSKYVMELLSQKPTIINREIMNHYAVFQFENIRIVFDGIFSSRVNESYKIALYQSRHDLNDIPQLIKDRRFASSIENYFIESINGIAQKYGLTRYDFELGSRNIMFSYSFERGRGVNKGWSVIKTD